MSAGTDKSTKKESHPAIAPGSVDQIQAKIETHRQSHLEQAYGEFHPETIRAADIANRGAGSLMQDLNRIFALCNGLATVMRIVSGNDVLMDYHDPDDAKSEPPLTRTAINSLVAMTAAVCEAMADDISLKADAYNDRGERT